MSSLWSMLFTQEKEIKLALVGLDGSGKTTIINKLIDGKFDHETPPTIGVDSKDIQLKNIHIKVFDLAGQESMRKVWQYYYANIEGIIFVVDAHAAERMPDAKEEIQSMLGDANAKKIPMLVYANKQDIEGSQNN